MLAAMRKHPRTHSFDHCFGQDLMQCAYREVEVFHCHVEDQPEVVVVARCLADIHAQRRVKQPPDAFACGLVLSAVQDGGEMDAGHAGR